VQRVLVVDDEELYRVYLRRFLEPLGYEVETADNGLEAIELARRFAPHLLIVDWRLDQGMDGLDVVQTLQAEMPQLRSIVISSYANDELRGRLESIPRSELMTKPLQLSLLLAATRNALEECGSE